MALGRFPVAPNFGETEFARIHAANLALQALLDARQVEVTAKLQAAGDVAEVDRLVAAVNDAANKDALAHAMNALGLDGGTPERVDYLFARIQGNRIYDANRVLQAQLTARRGQVYVVLRKVQNAAEVDRLVAAVNGAVDKGTLSAAMTALGLDGGTPANVDELFAEIQFTRIHAGNKALQNQLVAQKNQVLPILSGLNDVDAVNALVERIKAADKAGLPAAMNALGLDGGTPATVDKLFGSIQALRIFTANPVLQIQIRDRGDLFINAVGAAATIADVNTLVANVNSAVSKVALQAAMHALGLDDSVPVNVSEIFGKNQRLRIRRLHPALQAQLDAREAAVSQVLGNQNNEGEVDLLVTAVNTAPDKAALAAAMTALGLEGGTPDRVDELFANIQYQRILTGAGPQLQAKLNARQVEVKRKLAALTTVAAATALVDAVKNATKLGEAEIAMRHLGLATTNPDIQAIIKENRLRDHGAVSAGNHYDTPDKVRHMRHVDASLNSYLKRLDHFLLTTQEAKLSKQADLAQINKIDDTIHDLKIQLTKYKKMLEDAIAAPGSNPDFPADTPERVATICAGIAKLDVYLAVFPPAPAKGKIQEIEENVEAILRPVGAPAPKRLAYFNTSMTREKAHKADTYEAARYAVTDYFGAPPAPVVARLAHAPDAIKSKKDNGGPERFDWIPMDIAVKPATATEPAEIARTATIRKNTDDGRAVAELQFKDINQFKDVKTVGGFFTNIPGMPIMQWAAKNIKSFQAIMPNKNDPIEIETESLPEQLTRALVLYCAFKGIECTAPYEIKKKVEQKHIDLFTTEWAKIDPADKGKVEVAQLEVATSFRI